MTNGKTLKNVTLFLQVLGQKFSCKLPSASSDTVNFSLENVLFPFCSAAAVYYKARIKEALACENF